MNLVIIEVTPNFGEGAVVDVFSVKVGISSKWVDILELLVVGKPADNF